MPRLLNALRRLFSWRPGPSSVERERAELEARLFAATHDTLTGLMNRAEFQRAWRTIMEVPREGWLVMVDLDMFKFLNDRYGHTVGDEVLKTVAARLSGLLPRPELVMRAGGDEFVLLYADLPRAQVRQVADEILARVRQPVAVGEGLSVTLTASIGLVATRSLSRDEAVGRADLAMYAAKHKGRDRAVVYEPSLDGVVEARRELAATVIELQQQLVAVRDEARTDALTGLSNRRALDETLDSIAIGPGIGLAAIFIDLDHFGELNHRHGDAAGDAALRRVAAGLKSIAREDDMLFRKGGEEFLVLMPDVPLDEARRVGERIRESLVALGIPNRGGSGGPVLTATLGVAAGWTSTGAAAVVERAADAAMQAKVDGLRDAVHLAPDVALSWSPASVRAASRRPAP